MELRVIDTYSKEKILTLDNFWDELKEEKRKAIKWARINGYLDYILVPTTLMLDRKTYKCKIILEVKERI